MRKNKMMRIASVLMVAVLLSTCAISGTFAKYVAEGKAGDTARVAKWGVVITGSGHLFAENYYDKNQADGLANLPTTEEDSTKISVKSSGTEFDKWAQLVAPGTKSKEHTGFSTSLTGKPEVDARINLSVNARDVFLAAGTYAAYFYEVTVLDEADFNAKKNNLYKLDGNDYYTAKNDTYSADAVYYAPFGKVEVTGNGYFPVVYDGDGVVNNSAYETAKKFAGNLATKYVATDFKAPAVENKTDAANKRSIEYTATADFVAGTDLSLWGIKLENMTWKWVYNDPADTTYTYTVSDSPLTPEETEANEKYMQVFRANYVTLFEQKFGRLPVPGPGSDADQPDLDNPMSWRGSPESSEPIGDITLPNSFDDPATWNDVDYMDTVLGNLAADYEVKVPRMVEIEDPANPGRMIRVQETDSVTGEPLYETETDTGRAYILDGDGNFIMISRDEDGYVMNGTDVVASLVTGFNIQMTATQID